MNDERFDSQSLPIPEEPSVDELLQDARQTLDIPEEDSFINDIGYPEYENGNVPSSFAEPYEPSEYTDAPQAEPEAFEPDFGSAFEDYGEFDAEAQKVQQPEAPKKKRHLKRVKFPGIVFLILWFALILGLAVWGAKFIWDCADDAAALTRPDQNVEIRIDDDDDLDSIAEKLKTAGAIEKEWLFKFYCRFSHSENYFDPGVYNINLTYDYHALVNNLMAGAANRETTTVMVMEGLDCFELFDLLEENGVCSRRDLEEAAANFEFEYSFLEDRPYGDINRLEGYLFPDTYQFYLNDEPENVLDKLLDNFDDKMDDEMMELVNASGYSLHEILSMAAIIEGEAANDSERADVASVMYNRIHNWEVPLLGMDSTVFYAAKLTGEEFSTDLDSPYNTYVHPGLPVGPICNPGMNSILAALKPNSTDYFYFATAKDGLNRFFEKESDFLNFVNSEEYVGYGS